MIRGLALAVFVAASLLAFDAPAHERSQSFSSWRLHGEELGVVFSVPAREATRLAAEGDPDLPLETLLARHLERTLGARAGDAPCTRVSGPTPLTAREGQLRVELRWGCGASRPLRLEVASFFALAPSHVHFARLATDDDSPVELLFSERVQARVALAASGASARGETFLGHLWLGVEHIALGPDHLAFLVALLLFAPRARDVVVIVTGFTLGHSLTLALGALGLARPEPQLVEALIGFTIALVAAENITSGSGDGLRVSSGASLLLAALAGVALLVERGPPPVLLLGLALFTLCEGRLASTPERARRLRPALTVLFGLVHGFGFAGVLLEIGLPRERLLAALLGFNLGVELGQLAFVGVFAGLAWLTRRLAPGLVAAPVRDAATAALCGVGLYWFVARGYALLGP
ncbi:MAG: HupE/UreJ family protein [Myxococcota bacterium]